ncbi:MAG: HNH endonuclease [Sphaerochaeta sp.]|jgi:hypothetical protein|nr:HNH endonuclease [Sphaerochaeta sp.]
MKEIPLSRGLVALVDDEDYEWLGRWKWSIMEVAGGKFYAARQVRGDKVVCILMHRVIVNTPIDMHTDHVDGNGLNNQRANLRICTPSQNQANRRNQTGGSSVFKGVTWEKGKWRARIYPDGEKVSLGGFREEQQAAKAYNDAALLFYGGFARLNKIN